MFAFLFPSFPYFSIFLSFVISFCMPIYCKFSWRVKKFIYVDINRKTWKQNVLFASLEQWILYKDSRLAYFWTLILTFTPSTPHLPVRESSVRSFAQSTNVYLHLWMWTPLQHYLREMVAAPYFIMPFFTRLWAVELYFGGTLRIAP